MKTLKKYFLLVILSLIHFSSSLAYGHKVGELFMVDHYQSGGTKNPAQQPYKNWIKNKNLGALVFWNGDRGDSVLFEKMLSSYIEAARSVGNLPPIYTIDHEGRAVQHFGPKQGFTTLAYPRQLGEVAEKLNSYEVCYLHGQILTLELRQVGFNSALATVSDIRRLNRGTKILFRNRGISQNPIVVNDCIQEILNGSRDAGKFIFFTKHFPGLGSVSGNTDVGAQVSEASTSQEQNENLLPFISAIRQNNSQPEDDLFSLGIMTSGAIYPHLDSKFPAVESKVIQEDYLRVELQFKGLLTTDALWVGANEGLKGRELHLMLAQIVIAGGDFLMIPASTFEGAYRFFLNFYSGKIAEKDLDHLTLKNNFSSRQETLNRFIERVDESVDRIRKAKSLMVIEPAVKDGVRPRDLTAELRQRYEHLVRIGKKPKP